MIKIVKASSEGIAETAMTLSKGGIAVIPTCRWFMLCCLADAKDNIERIFKAKKRPSARQPLFVLPDRDSSGDYFVVGEGARRLIDRLWPGELTLILPWRDFNVASRFEAMNRAEALVYCPSGVLGEVATVVQAPLASTTVSVSDDSEPNNSGPAISVEEVLVFAHTHELNIEVVIDNGLCPAFITTTIVDCREPLSMPRLVREGFVHRRAIDAALLSEGSAHAWAGENYRV